MFNLSRVVQSVIDQIASGKTVPVKKEFQQMISDELAEKGISFTVSEDKTHPGRVLFKITSKV
jgi:hypothetical protein